MLPARDPYVSTAGAPVVVQGTVISAPTTTSTAGTGGGAAHPMASSSYNHATSSTNYVQENFGDANADFVKGEKQPKRCNDMAFAILFYAHLAVMAWVAATYVPEMTSNMAEEYGDYAGGGRRRMMDAPGIALQSLAAAVLQRTAPKKSERDLQDNGEEVDYGDVAFIMVVTGLVGLAISAGTLTFMMMFASALIKMALIFNIVVSLAMGIAGIVSGVMPMAILGFLSFAWSAFYARGVWPRIPFAAQNLITATTAVKKNMGLTAVAFSSLGVMLGWSLWWAASFTSAMFVTSGCNAAGVCEREANGLVVFLFLVSFYWSHQVIKNTVHCAVAGTVGTWWFAPHEASSCCSSAVRDSWIRSVTTSFGSICFGSLIGKSCFACYVAGSLIFPSPFLNLSFISLHFYLIILYYSCDNSGHPRDCSADA